MLTQELSGVESASLPSSWFPAAATASDITTEIKAKVGEMNRAPQKAFAHSSLWPELCSIDTLGYKKAQMRMTS